MALTSRTSIKRSYLSPCGRMFRLSQVYQSTRYDHLRAAPLGRIQMRLICRISRRVSPPVTSPFTQHCRAFGRKLHVHPHRYSRLFLTDWLSSGRVPLNDPSNRASFRDPGDLWLADRFKGDSFRLASTFSEQLFHHQLLLLAATPVAISLWGKTEPYQQPSLCVASDSV